MLAHKLPEENLVRLMQEAAGLGKPSVKSDGTLTFDYMLEASKIVEKNINSCSWYHETMEKFIADRRSKLVDYDKSEAMKKAYDHVNG